MDGGDGMNTATLLRQVEAANGNSFLNDAFIFVGTSAGGINALFLAKNKNPTNALSEIQNFWNDVNLATYAGIQPDQALQQVLEGFQASPLFPAVSNQWQSLAGGIVRNLFGFGLAAGGLRSVFLNDTLKQYLIQYFGSTLTLGDLATPPAGYGYVVIVSFELDNQQTRIAQSWRSRLFTNLPYTPRPGEPIENDVDELVVDVALRTATAPVELPIYQSTAGTGPGFVDGGLAANNPAMIALSAIAGTLSRGVPPAPSIPIGDALSQILLLSVGTGRNLVGTPTPYLDPEFTNGSAPWGYTRWLFDPNNPLVLVNAFLDGANEAVAWECGILLPDGNFWRLNVPLRNMVVADDPDVATLVQRTSAWLNSSGWTTPALPPPPGAVLGPPAVAPSTPPAPTVAASTILQRPGPSTPDDRIGLAHVAPTTEHS